MRKKIKNKEKVCIEPSQQGEGDPNHELIISEVDTEDVDEAQEKLKTKIFSEEGDDDVPEDVSWKASKEIAIQEKTIRNEILYEVKRKEKQARIERNERLREQKERKRAKEYYRLPQEVLQHAARQESEKEDPVTVGNYLTFESSKKSEVEHQEVIAAESEDAPGIKVIVLPKETRKPKKIQEAANLFLQEHLYGPRLHRISTVKAIDLKRKKRTPKPALKFSKK